jgi:hypothetical protein
MHEIYPRVKPLVPSILIRSPEILNLSAGKVRVGVQIFRPAV